MFRSYSYIMLKGVVLEQSGTNTTNSRLVDRLIFPIIVQCSYEILRMLLVLFTFL